MACTNRFTWKDMICVNKISPTNNTITVWFILTDLTSTDRSTYMDIISTNKFTWTKIVSIDGFTWVNVARIKNIT